MDRDALTKALAEVLRSGPPLRLAALFGSEARGQARPDSDVDVAILPATAALSLDAELSLQARLSSAIGREVDLVRLDHCIPGLRFRVAKEGLLLIGEPLAWKRFRAQAGIEYAEIEPQLRRARAHYLKRLGDSSQAGAGDDGR
jgi:predicted nucleotidyltransferase